MRQFDVIEVQGDPGIVVESHLLAPDRTVVVIPLIQDYPAVRLLNPVMDLGGTPHVLATRLISSVPKRSARPTGENLADRRDEIIRAIDVMISGI